MTYSQLRQDVNFGYLREHVHQLIASEAPSPWSLLQSPIIRGMLMISEIFPSIKKTRAKIVIFGMEGLVVFL